MLISCWMEESLWQTISADHVLFTLAIRNRLLIRWSRFLQDRTNTVDLLNLMIPNEALNIDRTSERMKSAVERQLSARKNPSECSLLLLLAAMLNFSFRDDVRVLIKWRARISLVWLAGRGSSQNQTPPTHVHNFSTCESLVLPRCTHKYVYNTKKILVSLIINGKLRGGVA